MSDAIHYEGRDLEVLADCPQYYRWIADAMTPYVRGCGIEYGPGKGTISKLVLPHMFQLSLVEPSPNLCQELENTFADNAEVSVYCERLETHVVSQPDASVDTVVMVNVLEHVEEDFQTLQELQRIIVPGGHLLLFVPALQWLMSDLDLLHGHYRRYHRKPLEKMCRKAGFEILSCRYWDVPGVFAWGLINTIGGSVHFNPRMVGIYDRYIVPVARCVESVVAPPLGKNLLLIAQRPLLTSI